MRHSVYITSIIQILLPVGYPLGFTLFGYYASKGRLHNVTQASGR